jgi:hypothetical protein
MVNNTFVADAGAFRNCAAAGIDAHSENNQLG